jgi:uncharacterized protein (TIGR02118 family)
VLDLTMLKEARMPTYVAAIYGMPTDPAAFEEYYFATHIPIAATLPGLRAAEITSGPIATPAGPSDVYRIALLQFDSLAAVQASLGSPEGQATAADLANFATGGVNLLIFETEKVFEAGD